MVVNHSWRRGFAKLSLPTCLLGVFFPFIIWTPLARFQPGLGDDGGNLNLVQKLYVFYKCPKVKYAGMMISFFLFIFLYSYVILFGYRWEYQIPELCLYVWIGVILVGEIRELFKEPSKRLKGKFRDYWSSIWNKFDTVFCMNAIIAFVLRQFRVTFWSSRIIMVVNCAIYYVRVFRIYHASRSLGPKLVIFQRMVSFHLMSEKLRFMTFCHFCNLHTTKGEPGHHDARCQWSIVLVPWIQVPCALISSVIAKKKRLNFEVNIFWNFI